MAEKVFAGFEVPKENWSKLPHVMVEALPLVSSMAELKVILYVLRHTWGYQEEERRISVDEFMNGRKQRKGGRIDGGTGLSAPAVRDGLARAVEHGFIVVDVDQRDLGRVQKWYALAMNDGERSLPPPQKDVAPTAEQVDPRTWKETEKEKKKETPPPASSPEPPEEKTVQVVELVDETDTVITCEGCDANIALASLEKARAECPACGRPMEVTDWNGKKIRSPAQKFRGTKASAEAGGSAEWRGAPFTAFWEVYGKGDMSQVPKKTRWQWGRVFQEFGEGGGWSPAQVAQGIRLMAKSEFDWMTFTSPYQDSFQNTLTIMMTRGAGNLAVGESGHTIVRQPGSERPGYKKIVSQHGVRWEKIDADA